MRSLLAAQPAVAETRTPALRQRLKSLLALKLSLSTPLMLTEPAEPAATLNDPADAVADSSMLSDPVPPELLLGDLAPRRPAFGQRLETVLELEEPAPAEPQRLKLLGADGAAVGEIILHGNAIAPANDTAPRRPSEPMHSEAPFFPEDLVDEPRPSTHYSADRV